jgi:predicted peroxiredoxin
MPILVPVSGLLIVGATGAGDATRASIPLHIAANGAGPAGVGVAVAFAGDAAELLKPDVIASLRGVGIPPLKELVDKCIAQNVPFYV